MKTHTEECKNCISTEGEDVCFDSMTEMWDYHKSQEPWYVRAWDFVYLPVHRFFRWIIWENVKPSNFKHWYQRARYGYSYRDCWSIDYHLSEIIPKMIRDMKKNLNGCPGDIADNWNGGETDDDMKMAMYEWETVLDKIANAFELENEIINHTLFDCRNKKEEKRMKKLMEDKDTFEGCRIMTTEEKVLRDKGWKLFRKYFYSLWD